MCLNVRPTCETHVIGEIHSQASPSNPVSFNKCIKLSPKKCLKKGIPTCSLLVGFVPASLARKYGCRPVGVAASLIACGGFLMSAFAPGLAMLYFSHGLVTSRLLLSNA